MNRTANGAVLSQRIHKANDQQRAIRVVRLYITRIISPRQSDESPISSPDFLCLHGEARRRERAIEWDSREGFPVRWSPIRASRCVEFQFGSSRLATSHRQFLHLSRCVPPSHHALGELSRRNFYDRSPTLNLPCRFFCSYESVCSTVNSRFICESCTVENRKFSTRYYAGRNSFLTFFAR